MKLLSHIIFFKLFVLLTIVSIPAFASSGFSIQQQVIPQTDTTKRSGIKSGLKSNPKDTASNSDKVEYSSKDSTKVNKKEGIVYLYGRARVIYQGLELDADYIEYNSKSNQIFAKGRTDAKGKYIGRPIFKMPGQGTSLADSLRYNTETGAGKIYGVFSEQEGGFFSGGIAKKQPDDEIHSKGQTYSTCNLPHPHFGIHITKGIVTEKQIITGPVYLKIEDIPLPIGLPFAFFPKPNKKSSGIILPTPGDDYTRGFFLKDGGYYLGLSDYWDAKLLASIYTGGSYQGSVTSTYTKRYKYNGNLELIYASNKADKRIEGSKADLTSKNYSINWTHSQNPNASPGSTFSANVRVASSDFAQATSGGGTYDAQLISSNLLSSSISYSKQLGSLFNLTSSFRINQNTYQRTIDLTLPQVNLTMQTIQPFQSKTRIGDPKWFEKITVGYSLESINTVNTTDSLLFKRETLAKFRNGFRHAVPVSINFNVLKFFNLGANVNYQETWSFQSIKQTYTKSTIGGDDLIRTDTIPGFNRYGTYNLGGSLSTKIYSTAQFTKLGNLKAIRHVMTPQIGFSYAPDFSDPKRGNFNYAFYDDDINRPVFSKTRNADGKFDQLTYSRLANTYYGGPSSGRSASIAFSLQNTVEAKVLAPKDTTGKGERKVPIINNLGINASYNFLAPDHKLSDINFSGSTPFTPKFQVNYSGTFQPYAPMNVTDTLNGVPTQRRVRSNDFVWQRGKLPFLTAFSLAFDYSLNPEALKRKNVNEQDAKNQAIQKGMTPEQAEALALVSRDPNAFVDFKIPWNFAFRYSFSYNTDNVGQNSRITNNLSFNGDANITPKWKVTFDSGWNFEANTFSITRFGIYRDLHCWDMSFSWIPFGSQQMYSVDIKVKASVLQDLKLSKRKNYYTRY